MTWRHRSDLFRKLVLMMMYVFSAASFAQSHAAQIRGPLPSSTIVNGRAVSLMPPGVPASVTSLGPFGYAPHLPNCCGAISAERRIGEDHFEAAVFVPGENFSYPARCQVSASLDPDSSDTGVSSTKVSTSEIAEYRKRVNDLEKRLREFEDGNDRTAHSANNSSQPPLPELPDIILVLRDGRSIKVKNYIMSKDAIYIYQGDSESRIGIDTLDLATTTNRNEERGLEFRLPTRKHENSTDPQ